MLFFNTNVKRKQLHVEDVVQASGVVRRGARGAAVHWGPKQQELPPDEEDRISAEIEVVAFLHSNTEACHPLPRKGTYNPAVILRFANRKHKMNLLCQGKARKGTRVYLNEHLTKTNGEIFKGTLP